MQRRAPSFVTRLGLGEIRICAQMVAKGEIPADVRVALCIAVQMKSRVRWRDRPLLSTTAAHAQEHGHA